MRIESSVSRLGGFVDRVIASPMSAAFGFLAVVTTLWGLVAIYKDLVEFGGTRTAAAFVVTLLALAAAPVILAAFFPSFRRRFNLPDGERYFYTSVERDWTILEDGSAIVETRKTFIFFSDPHPVDLSETAFSSNDFSVDDLAWQSDDAVIEDHERISDRMHRVYWKPITGSVRVGEPYTHHFRARYTEHVRRPPHKVMTIAAPARALKVRVRVRCELMPIKRAIAYRGSVRQRLSEADEIAARARTIRRTHAPAPILHNSHEVTWELDGITPESTYFLVLCFE